MSGSHQHGKEERHQRAQESNVVRMLAKHPFGYLDHPVHTAAGLQGSGAGNGRNDDIDDIRRRRTRFKAESENEDGKADAADGAQRQ